jgi:DNA-binding winged helix-turn-helix (wHTH) protein
VTVWFGEFSLDEARRELLRRGSPVHLTPKAFELLRLLVERRPAAVSKAEIHERVWPNTYVSEVNLATLVFEIRTAIDDDPHAPRYIRTVRGYGYAFCDDSVRADAPKAPSLEVHARLILSDREIVLSAGENILGRTKEAVAWLDHGSVSRRHARIVLADGQALIEDLGSRHGTLLNGVPVNGPTPLRDGSKIALGSLLMTFRVFAPRETDSASG